MTTIISFGKYKGTDVSQVPNDYLAWLLQNFDKSHWLQVALDELVKRGVAAVCDNGSAVRMKGGNGRFTVIKNAALQIQGNTVLPQAAGATMTVQTAHTRNIPAVSSAPPTNITPGNLLKHWGKLGQEFYVGEAAREQIYEDFSIDAELLSPTVKIGASILSQEAAIYGGTDLHGEILSICCNCGLE